MGQKISKPNMKAINDLVKQGADVNTQNKKSGWTSLHMAAYFNDTGLAKNILIYQGVNVNVKDSVKGATPLWYAAKQGSFRVTELLFQYGGVRVNAFEHHGTEAFDYSYSTALDVAEDYRIVQLLLRHNARKFKNRKK